jgi:predicted lipoprotein with Yx(FWY)xxD motif
VVIRRRAAITGSLLVAALALAACGDGGHGAAQGSSAQGGYAGTPAGPLDRGADGSGPPGIRAITGGGLGRIVVDDAGRPLYRFDEDTAEPPSATCAGGCSRLWPPVPWTGNLQVAEIDRDLVGRVRRADGGWQLTLGGWPLYRYAHDSAAGGARGQGRQGAWYVSAPDGRKGQTSDGKGGNNGGGNTGGGDDSARHAEGFERGGSDD